MAEEERLTKRERRQKKREERRRQEKEKDQKQLRRRITSGLATVVVVGFVGFIVWTAFAGGTDEIEETITVEAAAVTEAREAAQCEVVGPQAEFQTTRHFPQGGAPPADQIYPIRPPIGGPHFENTHPLVRDGASSQLNEIQTTHNLEHGAVIVWYDPEAVEDGAVGEMEAWSEQLNDSGFAVARAGAGIMVSPFDDPGLPEGTAVAMRAWGVGMDCASWDETAANGFVLQYFGDRGIAPEGSFAPFPAELLAWEGDPLPSAFQAPPPESAPGEEATGEPTEDATG